MAAYCIYVVALPHFVGSMSGRIGRSSFVERWVAVLTTDAAYVETSLGCTVLIEVILKRMIVKII